MKSIKDFVREAGISISCARAASNPAMGDAIEGADHHRCRITAGRSTMTVPFSMGKAFKGRSPTVEEVLDALASDAATVRDARNFEEWAENYGMSPDSRKAFASYEAARRQTDALKRLLGNSAFDTLLNKVERM